MNRKFALFAFLVASALFVLLSSQPRGQSRRLPAPQNVVVNDQTISWSAVAGARSYGIRYALARTPAGQPIRYHFRATRGTSFRFVDLDKDVQYIAQVRANAPAGRIRSVWSASVPVTGKLLPLDPPGNLRHVREATIAWDAVPGAAGYTVQWDSPTSPNRAVTLSNKTTDTHPGAEVDAVYTITIRSVGLGNTYKALNPFSEAWSFTVSAPDVIPDTATPTAEPDDDDDDDDGDDGDDDDDDDDGDDDDDDDDDSPTSTATATATDTATATATATDTATPTDTPTPVIEVHKRWLEHQDHQCASNEACISLVRERSCWNLCSRALPGSDCVKIEGSKACDPWRDTNIIKRSTRTDSRDEDCAATDDCLTRTYERICLVFCRQADASSPCNALPDRDSCADWNVVSSVPRPPSATPTPTDTATPTNTAVPSATPTATATSEPDDDDDDDDDSGNNECKTSSSTSTERQEVRCQCGVSPGTCQQSRQRTTITRVSGACPASSLGTTYTNWQTDSCQKDPPTPIPSLPNSCRWDASNYNRYFCWTTASAVSDLNPGVAIGTAQQNAINAILDLDRCQALTGFSRSGEPWTDNEQFSGGDEGRPYTATARATVQCDK